MELPILVETQPFILSHEMDETQGWKVGAMDESRIFAQLLAKIVGER